MTSSISQLYQRMQVISPFLNISEKRLELAKLESAVESSQLWENKAMAIQLLSKREELKDFLQKWQNTLELVSLAALETELSTEDYRELAQIVISFERQALLAGEHDHQAAILTIHAGTGGVDAQDFTEMLQRMYLRYIEKGKTEQQSERTLDIDRTSWQPSIIELTRGEEAGFKKVVIEVRGDYAYGILKSEAGVHRLVRLSPYNAKNLRQTSFALVEVIPEIEQSTAVKIAEKEIRIDVYRAGGHGGQGVNTTDSAVRITHLPTGLVVCVQNERSQYQNKLMALKILESRLIRLKEVQNTEETAILKGEFKEGSWGNQIRSYTMQPYQLVKDHRTGYETARIANILDGELTPLIQDFLMHVHN